MSFVKKAAKKVFKGIKKVVKKVWKPVLIGAAIFFTAGVAAVGFGAFAGATASFGSFMGAVGTTMVAGGQAMLGTVGLSSGLSAATASATGSVAGTTLLNGALAQGLGLSAGLAAPSTATAVGGQTVSTSSLAGLGGSSATGGASMGLNAAGVPNALAAAAGSAAPVAGTGFMSKVGSAVKGMMPESAVGKMALYNGISNGIQSYMASEEASKERKRDRRRNFYGGPMRGGTDIGIDFPEMPTYARNDQGQAVRAPQAGLDPVFAQGQIPQQPQAPNILQPGNLDLLADTEQQPVQFMSRPPAFGGFT